MSHYETLGVPRDATAEEIKMAFRKKAQKAHPDKNNGDSSKMVALNRAYETLSDKDKREMYDRTGEDGKQPSVEDRAMQLVSQGFEAILDEDEIPPHANPIDLIKGSLAESIKRAKFEVKKCDAYIQKLNKRAARLKKKNKQGTNMWSFAIDGRRRKYEGGKANSMMFIEAATMAIAILEKEYEGVATEKEKPAKESHTHYYADLSGLFGEWKKGQ